MCCTDCLLDCFCPCWSHHITLSPGTSFPACADCLFLFPAVITHQVASLQRTHEDELLILASDGLRDVFSCQEATHADADCLLDCFCLC
jgi:hypothetical protein